MERLDCFNVSTLARQKYYKIYEQISRAEELPVEEIRKRAESISFAGYIVLGNRLITENADIDECYRRGDYNLCLIPFDTKADLLGLRIVRQFNPAPQLRPIGATTVYTPGSIPYLNMENVVAQLSPAELKRAKAFALRLKDDFVETGYLNLAQAYEYHIELLA